MLGLSLSKFGSRVSKAEAVAVASEHNWPTESFCHVFIKFRETRSAVSWRLTAGCRETHDVLYLEGAAPLSR